MLACGQQRSELPAARQITQAQLQASTPQPSSRPSSMNQPNNLKSPLEPTHLFC